MEMMEFEHIRVAGTGRLASGIVTNFLKSGRTVQFSSKDPAGDKKHISDNIEDWLQYQHAPLDVDNVCYISSTDRGYATDLVVGITEERLSAKQDLIAQMEDIVAEDTVIALNTESIGLHELQQNAKHPERIIGLNWTDPAFTSFFLEIIANELSPNLIIQRIQYTATKEWEKDPYVIRNGHSIRSRLIAALIRESFYLIENGYASVKDIDRACRNDAGYYLPFAGNCRYMDLMGTYAYGLVMKDLNRELSKATSPPAFFTSLIESGKTGMESKEGLYKYSSETVKQWEQSFRKFSFEIRELIDKYPFNYLNEEKNMEPSKAQHE